MKALLKKSDSHIDRYYRLWRVYVFRQGGVRKLWTAPGQINEARFRSPTDLMVGYFLDYSSDASYDGPFDPQGVPLIDYSGTVGIQYNPWAVGHLALALFHRFLQSRDSRYRERFLVLADWFLAHKQYQASGIVLWPYNFDYPPSLQAPWYSSLAQSVAISVLLRAYLWTKKLEYLETAQKAFHAFTVDVAEGGLLSRDQEGYLFFEEVVPARIYHILNGFISTLWGIFEYELVTNDPRARLLFNQGIASLEHYLPQYDTGWASLYSLQHLHKSLLLKDVASLFYQAFHVQQVEVLYRLTGRTLFEEYRKKWESYLHSPVCRARTFAAKALFKLLYY